MTNTEFQLIVSCINVLVHQLKVFIPSLRSWQRERWTTARRCCSSWRWWAEGSWVAPTVRAACSVAAFRWAAHAGAPGSACSTPESVCSGDSSYGDLHPLSCTSNESGRERSIRNWASGLSGSNFRGTLSNLFLQPGLGRFVPWPVLACLWWCTRKWWPARWTCRCAKLEEKHGEQQESPEMKTSKEKLLIL